MGSESGGSAVDSVAGEHSGNVPWGRGVPGRGRGQNRKRFLGLGLVSAEGSFGDSLKALWNSLDLTPRVSNVQ